jgi:hypothetical protein
MSTDTSMLPEPVESSIVIVRGQKVILDDVLATLYGVTVGRLNEAIKRNATRFPPDFMFQLTLEESNSLLSQIAIAKIGRGGRRTPPFAFTEHGVAMLSSVLSSERAVAVNIQIIRAFIRLRQILATNEDLARKLVSLEKKYDAQFKTVFDAIRQLMAPALHTPKPRIGFQTEEQRRQLRDERSAKLRSKKQARLNAGAGGSCDRCSRFAIANCDSRCHLLSGA